MSIKKIVHSGKIDKINNGHPGALEEIGKRVKEVRETLSKPIRQEMFAKELSLSLSKINRIEKGRRSADLDFLLRIKKKYDCDLNWLLVGKGTDYAETRESDKKKLLSMLKSDQEFRSEVLNKLELKPPTEVMRNDRIRNQLLSQRSDWVEIIDRSEQAVIGASGAEKERAEEGIQEYRTGVAYLDVLLEVGKDSD